MRLSRKVKAVSQAATIEAAAATESVDRILIWSALGLGASERRLLWEIALPAAEALAWFAAIDRHGSARAPWQPFQARAPPHA